MGLEFEAPKRADEFNYTSVICLYTMKCSNNTISNNSIEHKSYVCTQIKCQTVLFDLLIRCNDIGGVFHFHWSSRIGASPSVSIVSFSGHSLGGRVFSKREIKRAKEECDLGVCLYDIFQVDNQILSIVSGQMA